MCADSGFLSREQELALTSRLRAGDGEAWGTLHQRFIAALTGFIAARIGNIEDAEDLAQECFLRAKDSIERDSYDRRFRVYTFLRSIAVHVIANYWERRSVRARGASHTEPEGARRGVARSAPREVALDEGRDSADVPAEEMEGLERLELLRLVFLCCAKPHQLVAFGLVTILEWRPKELLAERADSNLGELAREFSDGYHASLAPFISRERFLRSYCAPLFDKLGMSVGDLYAEREYAELVATHGGSKAEGIPFRAFWGRDASASLSDWCDKVKRRARRTALTGILCRS